MIDNKNYSVFDAVVHFFVTLAIATFVLLEVVAAARDVRVAVMPDCAVVFADWVEAERAA